jgi:SAM-dependent methyltransferase
VPASTTPTEKVQGHWLLAHLGKKVLRPGGRQLTTTMLDALGLTPTDRVVELAPGLGATARAILARHPATYTAVDADADAAATTQAAVAPAGGTVLVGPAQHVPLPDDVATVVVGEAMLTMQSDANKAAVVSEAARLLATGGRYAIHELCLTPDDLDPAVAQQVWDDLSRTIHVGARPLTAAAWRALLEAHGFEVLSEHRAPMALLSPRRIVADEGLASAVRFFGGIARDRTARRRVGEMRRCFGRWSDHLAAVAFVARRVDTTTASATHQP